MKPIKFKRLKPGQGCTIVTDEGDFTVQKKRRKPQKYGIRDTNATFMTNWKRHNVGDGIHIAPDAEVFIY